jgi:ribonuclease J
LNKLSVVIYQSATEIGGNNIQFFNGKDSILIDYGSPIMDGKTPKIFDEDEAKNINAFLISHPHLDHTGMAGELKDVPFYLGYDTEKTLKIQFLHTKRGANLSRIKINNFSPYKEFTINSFKILPISVNHSSYGTYSFILQANRKKIFYSGDLRAHGRSEYKWKRLIETLKREQPFDLALLEGTNLSSDRLMESRTEQQIENLILMRLQESTNPVLIQFSPLNLDRFVSTIKACVKAQRTFIIDSYAAHFLNEISKNINPNEKGRAKVPSWKNKIFKLYSSNATKNIDDEDLKSRIFRNSIKEGFNLKNCVMLVRSSMMKERLFQSFDLTNSCFIYSQYSGYREMHESQKKFEDHLKKKGVSLTDNDNIHTSGHIDIKSMKELLEVMKPKLLIPIHSANRESIKDIYKGDVEFLNNGNRFDLS